MAGHHCPCGGWLGLKNGPLMEAMAERQLRVLVTADRTLYRAQQHRVSELGIGVVLVRDAARAFMRIEQIARAVLNVRAGELVEVGHDLVRSSGDVGRGRPPPGVALIGRTFLNISTRVASDR